MRSLALSKLNPVNIWLEKPEAFLLEHCGNLVKAAGGNLEERILFFVKRLYKLNHKVPRIDLNKFPKELHSERMKKMCSYSAQMKAA